MKHTLISRRPFRDDINLSVIGLGGMLLVGMEQGEAGKIVMQSFEQGINYFDVAPFYGNGEAELKMGIALQSFRKDVFLACKTMERSAKGAQQELDRSLNRLRTDHFELYQFHSISSVDEVDEIFASGGAFETFCRAREHGKIRYIGFSAHSVPAALAMMDRFQFDSVLFPVNFVCYARGNFGPQVIRRAGELNVARLAIKALAHGPWRKNEERKYPKCWYRPIEDSELARSAMRFTLSEDVTAAIPPGDERLFRMVLRWAHDLPPLEDDERRQLLESTRGLRPLLRA
jgi:aryl-alcohol dehydrogenase-like predicted oxidoreductase